MANYYHEARAQVRNMKKTEEQNRRRAERRAELATAREDVPIHRLQIDGRACKLHIDTQEYENVEQMKTMVPWNGDHGCLIDRFDARAMLDFYQEPRMLAKARSNEDGEVEERVAFESFRDLVKLVRKGLSDAAGLAYAADEALDLRVAARTRASAAAGVPTTMAVAPAGDAATALLLGAEGEEAGEEDAAEDEMIEAVEDDAAALDEVAGACGIAGFSAQLQRAVVQEEEEMAEELRFLKPKRLSRRKMAERVRRMLGQGVNPFGKSKAWWKETARSVPSKRRERASPDYGAGRDGARRCRPDKARTSPRRSGQVQFISEFTDVAPPASSSDDDGGGGATGPDERGGDAAQVLEALPGRADPATTGGPVALPAAGAIMRGRREFTVQDWEAERRAFADRGKIQMNQASVAPSAGAGATSESKQDRLKRLMAAQFNSNVAKDTKKTLAKRAREDSDRRAQEALERHAASLAQRRSRPPIGVGEERTRSPSPSRQLSPGPNYERQDSSPLPLSPRARFSTSPGPRSRRDRGLPRDRSPGDRRGDYRSVRAESRRSRSPFRRR